MIWINLEGPVKKLFQYGKWQKLKAGCRRSKKKHDIRSDCHKIKRYFTDIADIDICIKAPVWGE